MNLLKKTRVCVSGCGGLGGYVIEMLARLGIGYITAIDGDCFDETNLNRQLLATEANLGKSKAKAAAARVNLINSQITCHPVHDYLTENNALEMIAGHNVVIDALDSIPARFILQTACQQANIPLVHGAVTGWYGQVCTILPEENTLEMIYRNREDIDTDKDTGVPAFSPAAVSAIQVSETIKLVLGKGSLLRNKLLMINLLENEYHEIPLKMISHD